MNVEVQVKKYLKKNELIEILDVNINVKIANGGRKHKSRILD